jgi:hypothetical protein
MVLHNSLLVDVVKGNMHIQQLENGPLCLLVVICLEKAGARIAPPVGDGCQT